MTVLGCKKPLAGLIGGQIAFLLDFIELIIFG